MLKYLKVLITRNNNIIIPELKYFGQAFVKILKWYLFFC
jgi:hypothetical protein